MKILRVNTETGDIRMEPAPVSWQHLGGRGLIARIMLDEIPPECEPLGMFNKLIFTPGLLTGHMISSCDRISVGGKSPLTGGIKEANAGGITGNQMVWLGLKALIVEGGPPAGNRWKLLFIDDAGARFEPAGDLAGLGLQDTANALMHRFGEDAGIAAIGPGGEMKYLSAGITHTDKDRNQSRISARGGLGAVMGSKRLKAVVFKPPRSNRPPLMDKELFRNATRRYIKALQDSQQINIYSQYGTAAMVNFCSSRGGLPTRNFSSGNFEGKDKISGEAIHDLNLSRKGDISHGCMPGCFIKCSNVYHDENEQVMVTPLEYETIALMGSNLGFDDPDAIAQLNAIANDFGVDTIEVGATLGVLGDAGLLEWGDADRAIELMEEMRQGTPLGRILANGAGLAGKILGVERVPVAKNQAFAGYDPRAVKATGVTFATTPQGADHTCGNPIRANVDHTDPACKMELSREAQYASAANDTLGICLFAGFGFGTDPTLVPDFINGQYGWNVDQTYMRQLGREVILMEREFNRRAGFTPADDRLPEWLRREPLPPTQAVFDVPEEELDSVFDA